MKGHLERRGGLSRTKGQSQMKAILLMILAFAGYLIAYHTYGRFLARKIFNLSSVAQVPSKQHEDGKDFVPTKKIVIFGHHYTSIAGTGPIVGPAIGIIWGWVPALVWVFAGSILMGAVHDFGALVLSLRNQGKSVSEIAARYVGSRVRYTFFLIIFFELLIVIAVFGLVISVIFAMFPASVFPIWMEIPIAIILGWLIYRRSVSLTLSTALAVGLMYATVMMGHFLPLSIPQVAGIPATGIWTIILLAYAYLASTVSVKTLLQPRDYINAFQLFIAMGLLAVGVVASGLFSDLEIVAPAVNLRPEGAPPVFPFLFIVIACGAISGFHSLVSSGTSSKQVSSEPDAQFVGYGSMLMEAALATVVIIAVCAGIGLAYKTADGEVLTGAQAWSSHYSSWAASEGLGSKITAFVVGSANMMATIGIPRTLGTIIMGVFVASFAGTTLDTATRIQRYVITELSGDLKIRFLGGKYVATALAVGTAAFLAFATGADGNGALKLWPMFGAVNQLLAALVLIVITIYLKQRGGLWYLLTGIPALFMLIVTVWGVVENEVSFVSGSNWLLAFVNGAVLILSCWVMVEGVVVFTRGSKQENPGRLQP
jgi:carbon starvation protein